MIAGRGSAPGPGSRGGIKENQPNSSRTVASITAAAAQRAQETHPKLLMGGKRRNAGDAHSWSRLWICRQECESAFD